MRHLNIMRSPADRRIDGEIRILALPALGALAADPLVSVVDTAFVGRLGTLPLAALGINTAIFTFAFVVFNFLAYATTPRIAHALGRGARREAEAVSLHALVLALAVGGLATLLLLLLGPVILVVMGAAGDLYAQSLTYLRIRALAGPAVLVIMAGHGIFRGYQDTATPMRLTLGMNLVNLILDPLLIFGLGWGLAGAAWATVLAQWSGAAAFLFLFAGAHRSKLGHAPQLPRFRDVLPFVRIGMALFLRTMALIGTLTLATAVATRLGPDAVAGHQVAMQIWLMLALVVDALAVAAQTLVARYRGAGHASEVKRVVRRLLAWGVASGSGLALVFALAAPWLPGLFTDDPASLRQAAGVFVFVVWMQPLNALVFVGDGVFMGLQSFRLLAAQMLFSALSASAVLIFVLPMDWGLEGVWWAVLVLMVARLLTQVLTYRWALSRPEGPPRPHRYV